MAPLKAQRTEDTQYRPRPRAGLGLSHAVRRKRSATPTARAGIATVEFAVVLPLLILVVLGMLELGRILQIQQVMQTAAREGARQAAGGNRSNTDVSDVVSRYVQQARIPTNHLTVTMENLTNPSSSDPREAQQMDQIRVSVSVPYNEVSWIASAGIASRNTVTGTATWLSIRDRDFPEPGSVPIE